MSFAYDPPLPEPVAVEVVAIESLPIGANASRSAVVRWSDGSQGDALRWFDDLCGCPHKSSYAEGRVMPTRRPDHGRLPRKLPELGIAGLFVAGPADVLRSRI
jgi:hypothetical protein